MAAQLQPNETRYSVGPVVTHDHGAHQAAFGARRKKLRRHQKLRISTGCQGRVLGFASIDFDMDIEGLDRRAGVATV